LLDSLWTQVIDGVVYVNAHRLDAANNATTYVLQANDGKQLWSYQSKYSTSVALVERGIVYLSEQGTPPTQTQAAGPGSIVAVQAGTGRVLWRQSTDGVPSLVKLVDGVMYFVAMKATMEPPSSNAALGSALWSLPLLQPQIPHKGAFSSVYALRLSDGQSLWHASLNNGKQCWANWLILDNGTLYVSATGGNDRSGSLYALRTQDGSLAWQRGFAGSPGEAMMQDGIIYFSASSEGGSAIYALRLNDGKQLWSYPIDGYAGYGEPLLRGTMLYVGGDNTMVYALDARTGRLLWHYGVAVS